MKHNDEILNAIDSTVGRLVILLVAFIAQVPHTIAVFQDGATCANNALACTAIIPSIAAGIALEGGILFVLLRGWHMGSYAFALISVAINVAFFTMKHDGNVQSLSWIEWLKSAIVPAVIAVYSHLIASSDAKKSVAKRAFWIVIADKVRIALRAKMQELQGLQSAQPVQIAIDDDEQESANETQSVSDAKSLYLQLRSAGRNHKELVQELQLNASTAASWWNRRDKNIYGFAGD